jgi:hypothetical protein
VAAAAAPRLLRLLRWQWLMHAGAALLLLVL